MHPLVTSRPTFYNGSPRVLKLSVLTAVKRSSSTAFSSIFHLTPRLVSPLQLTTLVSFTTSDYRSLPPVSRRAILSRFCFFCRLVTAFAVPFLFPSHRHLFQLSLPSPHTLFSLLSSHLTTSPTSTSSFPVGASVFPAGHDRRAAHKAPSFCSSAQDNLLGTFRGGGEINAASDAR